jgi:hypothetical protein
MTRPREIEGLLDQWFGDGPRELSDRALTAALSEIDHTRQLGAHVVPWRYNEMPTPVRILLVAALMAASAGAALLISAGTRNNTAPPSPPPSHLSSVSPSAPPSAQPSQVSLGPGESIGHDPAGTYTAQRAAGLGLPAGQITLTTPRQPTHVFVSPPDGPEITLGRITIQGDFSFSMGPIQGCEANIGQYTWGLSADTNTLTITALDDDCIGRATLFAGDWQRTRIERDIATEHRYRVPLDGATIDITVPAKFASGGSPDYRTSMPAFLGHFETEELSFLMYTESGKTAADRCDPEAGYQPLPTTLDGYVEWTKSSEGLNVSRPVETTVAGYPAVRLDFDGNPYCQPDHDGIPATYWVRGMYGREWAVDVGGRLVLLQLIDDARSYEPLTPEMLALGDELLASMEISPTP